MGALALFQSEDSLSWLRCLLTCATLAGSASSQSGLPLDELGRRLLEKSARGGGAKTAREDDLVARTAPLHERVLVGGFELWWPREALEPDGRWRASKLPRESDAVVGSLARLQSLWTPRLTDSSDARVDAAELERWALGWKEAKGRRVAPPPGASRVARVVRGASWSDTSFGYVIAAAPTRAQLVGLAGAYVACNPAARGWVDDVWLQTCAAAVFPRAMRVIAWTAASATAAPASMKETPFDFPSVLENFVHHASHELTRARLPNSPPWWTESLALYDSLSLLGRDETPCTGYWAEDSDTSFVQTLVQQFQVDVRKSPFRGPGSENYFVDALRSRLGADGFELIDLQTKSTRVRVKAPFLGEGAGVPPIVDQAPIGVKQAYAEFHRAYGAAFVRFLDSDGTGTSPSSLQRICRALLGAQPSASSRRDPRAPSFHEVVRDAASKSIGASLDPAVDHEAAFVAWLRR